VLRGRRICSPVSHHGGGCKWEADLKNPSSISVLELLLLHISLDLAASVAEGMVRPQDCLAEFISDGKLEPPLPSAERKASPCTSASCTWVSSSSWTACHLGGALPQLRYGISHPHTNTTELKRSHTIIWKLCLNKNNTASDLIINRGLFCSVNIIQELLLVVVVVAAAAAAGRQAGVHYQDQKKKVQ
jgi:hypothetical protein